MVSIARVLLTVSTSYTSVVSALTTLATHRASKGDHSMSSKPTAVKWQRYCYL